MKYSYTSKNSEDSASLLEILKSSHLSLVFCEVVHLHSRVTLCRSAHPGWASRGTVVSPDTVTPSKAEMTQPWKGKD